MEKSIRYAAPPARHEHAIKLIGRFSAFGGAIVSVVLLLATVLR